MLTGGACLAIGVSSACSTDPDASGVRDARRLRGPALVGSARDRSEEEPSWRRSASSGAGSWARGSPRSAPARVRDVVVVERDAEALKAGQARVERSLVARRVVGEGDRGRRRGRASEPDLRGRPSTSSRDRELVIEAVLEDEGAKVEVFRHLDEVVVSDDAILATNTSSIPIIKLAMATKRPEQVIGMHFFNPVPVLKLVEVISSLLTSPETTDTGPLVRDRAARASASSPRRTAPASSSTRCSSRTCSRRSGCSSRASRAPRTSTRGWSSAAPTRSGRSRSRTSSGSTPPRRSPSRSTRSSRSPTSRRRRCCHG